MNVPTVTLTKENLRKAINFHVQSCMADNDGICALAQRLFGCDIYLARENDVELDNKFEIYRAQGFQKFLNRYTK